MELKNKIVVITGGGKGFGKTLAESFLAEGAKVVVANKTESDFKGDLFILSDVRNQEDLEKIAENTIEKFGRIDIWINNAGVLYKFGEGEKIDPAKAKEIFEVNVLGTAFGCEIAKKVMKEKGGAIINILSSAALDATRAKTAKLYAASKWAVRGFTDAFRAENQDTGISVFGVYPGGIKTDLYGDDVPTDFDKYMEPACVTQKVIDNLKLEQPELDLVIKRPTA